MAGVIKTYIDGFDEKIEGGIPEGHVVLISGEPGTMKSSVAFNLLYRNAIENDMKGVYVTLEQNRASLTRHLKKLGMDMDKVQGKIDIVDLGVIRKNLLQMGSQTWMEVFKMYAQNLRQAQGYDMLVVDSLPALELLAKFTDPRDDLFQFFEWLRGLDATVFLISEMEHNSKKYSKHDADFLSDGIIYLRLKELDVINVQRHIRCIKMRSADHSHNYFALLFQDGGFQATRIITDQL